MTTPAVTAIEAVRVRLRPAVAVTNSDKAGKTRGLGIERQCPSIEKGPDAACCARPIRQSAPAAAVRQRQPENSVIAPEGAGIRLSKRAPQCEVFWPGSAIIPDKTSLFPPYIKASRRPL